MTVGVALRLVAVMGLWATCFPLITLGLGLAPHLLFAALRAALAGLLLLAVGAGFRRPVPRGRQAWALIVLVGLASTSLGFLGMFHAAEFVSPGLATVIVNAQPLLAAILAHAVLGERLKGRGMTGLAVGFAGIVAIAWPGLAAADPSRYSFGIAYLSVAVVGVAVGNIAMKRLSAQIDAVMAMGFQFLLGAMPLALASVLTEDLSSIAWSGEFAIVLAALAMFGTALAFWLWFDALKRVELNRANAFTFLVPLLGLAVGAAAFGERLGWTQAMGAALILGGVALVQREARAMAARARPSETVSR